MKVTRKTYKSLKWLVLFVALALVVTAVPLGLFNSAPKVIAANVTSYSSLKSTIENASSGSTIEVTVPSGQNLTADFNSVINVKSNKKVTVINNGNITVSANPGWSNVRGNMFYVEGATLTLSGSGTYQVNYERVNMTVAARKHEIATSNITIVENKNGTVNVTSGTFYVVNKLEYNDTDQAYQFPSYQHFGNGNVFVWGTGIWNRTDSSKVNITGGTIDVDAWSACVSSSDDDFGQMNNSGANGGMRCFSYAYGVYGGAVNMNGGKIDAYTSAWYKCTGSETRRAVVGSSISYGIMSENVHMTNGQIITQNKHGRNEKSNICGEYTRDGTMSSWSAGIAYKSTPPVVDGGTITTDLTTGNSLDAWSDGDIFSQKKYAIMKTPSASCVSYDPANYYTNVTEQNNGEYPLSSVGKEHRWKSAGSGWQNVDTPYLNARGSFSGEPSEGTAEDSNGRSTTYNQASMSKAHNGSATAAKNMYIYRYYNANGTLNKWSYSPDTSVAPAISISGVTTGERTATNATIQYSSGGAPSNRYKWELKRISHYTAGYGDTVTIPIDTMINSKDGAGFNGWEVVDSWTYPGASHTRTRVNGSHPNNRTAGYYVFVFIDYQANNTEELRFTSTPNLVLDYDGAVITAADCGVTVYGTRNTSATTDDDVLYSSSVSVVSPSFSYTGTSPSGKSLSGSGLPKDAGTYTVTITVAANTNTNRKALSGTFKVTINQITDPEFNDGTASTKYLNTLGDVTIPVSMRNSALKNDFDYTWNKGADYKPVCAESGNFAVTATPKAAVAENYKSASYSFYVNLTVNPRDIAMIFGAANVEYGEELDIAQFTNYSDGGTATITDANIKNEIINTIKNDIKLTKNSASQNYIPGTTLAGDYTWGLETTPLIKGNFAVSMIMNGTVTVNKAPLTVTARTAKDTFPYESGKTGETIKFALADVSGIKDSYDSYGTSIIVDDAEALYPNGGNAGTGKISLAAEPTLSGVKKDCYYIASVNYADVTITKASVPSSIYEFPALGDIEYDPLQTLGHIAAAYDMSDPKGGGSFRPKDANVVPTVNKDAYTFIYTPADSVNYAETEVEFPLSIAKRTVTVSAQDYSVEYGSEVPDPATYVWTFSNWTADAAAPTDGSAFPVLTSIDGKVVTAGETADKTLGMSGAWNTSMLTSGYTPSTDAGTPVYISVNGTFDMSADNYNFVFEQGNFTVTKRQLEIVAPDCEAIFGVIPQADVSLVEYGTDEHGFAGDDTAASVFGESNPVSFVYGLGAYGEDSFVEYVPGTSPVGEYNVYPYFANETLTNYELIKTPGTLTVNKRVVTVKPMDVSLVYGDDVPASFEYYTDDTAVDLSEVFSGSVTTETNYTKGSNAGGSYYIKAVCNDDGSFTADQQPGLTVDTNYSLIFGDSAVLTVSKAVIPASAIAIDPFEIVYSETLTLNDQLKNQGKNEISFEYNGMTVTGEISYELGGTHPHVSDTGEFEVNFTPTGDSEINYNEVNTGLTGYVTIAKAPVAGNLQIGGQLMAGGVVYPATGGLVPSGVDNYNFAWYFVDEGGAETLAGENRTLILKDEDEGKTVKVVATIDEEITGDYYGSVEYTSSVKVSPPLTVIKAEWIVSSFETPVAYDGMGHGAEASLSNIPDGLPAYDGTVTVKYNGEEVLPVDAGTYYVTVDCSGDSNYAATTAVQIGTIVITPRELTLAFAVQDKTYDSTTKASFPTAADGSADKSSIRIASGLVESDADGIALNVNNAKAVFDSASAGEAKSVQLLNVYLTGDRASNYTLGTSTANANILKARVTATAKLKNYSANYSENLTDENASGVYVYFSNVSGVMSRDKSTFRIAEDSVAVVSPKGGENCAIDMNTVTAVPNNDNYFVDVVNTETIYILINKIAPVTASGLTPEELTLSSRVYDSKAPLTDEELRSFIAEINGGAYADTAQYYSWVRNDGAAPVPQVSTTSTPRSYYVTFDNGDPNFKTVIFKVRVPVTKKNVTIQAANFNIPYGSENPLQLVDKAYVVTSGLYPDETLLSVFKAEPTARTNYLRYSNIGEYSVTLSAANLRNNNYTLTVNDGTITVTKVRLTAQAQADSKLYDGKTDNIVVMFSELKGKVRENDDVYLPAYVTGSVADANAGAGKQVTIAAPVLSGSAAGNYDLTITNLNRIFIDVEKIMPTDYRFPNAASITFGEPLSSAVLDGSEAGDGRFYFELSNEIPAAIGVFANVYDMVFEPSNSNYETVKQKVALEVNIAHLEPTPVITGSIIVGNTLTATVPGVPGAAMNYIHYTWYRVDDNGSKTEIGSDTSTYTLTSADIGYKIQVAVSFGADDPYQGEGETLSQTIKEEHLTFWQKIWKWWYSILAAIKKLFRR